MPMQRVANTAFDQKAQHFTIIRIVNTAQSQFGFGISDDGEDVFLPGPIIRKHNLTDLDEGAGFRALVRPSPPDIVNVAHHDRPNAKITVIPPMVLDDQDPTYVPAIPANRAGEIQTPDEAINELKDDVFELANRFDSALSVTKQLDEALVIVKALTETANKMLSMPLAELLMAQKTVAPRAEKLNEILVGAHNALTEQAEWLDENYPDDEAQDQPVAKKA